MEHRLSGTGARIRQPGATHNFTTCTKCEKTPGEFGDTVKTTFDYVDAG